MSILCENKQGTKNILQRGTITTFVMPKIDGSSITYLKGKEGWKFILKKKKKRRMKIFPILSKCTSRGYTRKSRQERSTQHLVATTFLQILSFSFINLQSHLTRRVSLKNRKFPTWPPNLFESQVAWQYFILQDDTWNHFQKNPIESSSQLLLTCRSSKKVSEREIGNKLEYLREHFW